PRPVARHRGAGARPAPGASIYEDALGRAGIPFRHEGGRSFFVRQEVRELVSCPHAIDDPTDRRVRGRDRCARRRSGARTTT
ncbi:MAG: hypothetical protein WKF31_04165, partial [Thermoleophilaceae bacterium]